MHLLRHICFMLHPSARQTYSITMETDDDAMCSSVGLKLFQQHKLKLTTTSQQTTRYVNQLELQWPHSHTASHDLILVGQIETGLYNNAQNLLKMQRTKSAGSRLNC